MATGYPSIDKTHQKGEMFWERHPIIPNVSIYTAFRLMCRPFLNDTAIDCDGLTVTFRELLQDADDLSRALSTLGVKAGEIIALRMPNLYQGLALFLGANRAGIGVTFLNALADEEEVSHYLRMFDCPLMVDYGGKIATHSRLLKMTPIRHIVTLGREEAGRRRADVVNSAEKDILSYSELISLRQKKRTSPRELLGGQRTALVLFTSGTTGAPKSVVLTNRNILSAATYLKNSSHISHTRGEKSLVCVPFMHPYGFSTSAIMSLLCGRQLIIIPNVNGETILSYLKKAPNIIFGSPVLLELILRNIPEEQDLSSITTFISGGDYLTTAQEAAGKNFFARHGANVTICNGSGNAETASCGTNLVGVKPRAGTVGRILTGSDAVIVDPDTFNELKYGEEGVLCISGGHVFKEYYKDPELTAKAKWRYKGKEYFVTGTMGILDEDGYFTLTGRAARFYIALSLNKVYCERVQNIIAAMDGVAQCAVVKKPDREQVFVCKAYIVPTPDAGPSEELLERLRAQCSEPVIIPSTGEPAQLKPYEIPGSFEILEQLPYTKAGKIDYQALERDAGNV